ncbi:putative N-acetyltransferase YoaA [Colletotrichum tanaceti]|uniref:Putative N-acetyltransferase YoaA n=1 Tax=Colletotrichum tanaceti TaxID=1306861 RepID=A0A4U6XT99_9PEZI|nr:putative N-acetyltransferase YoaA [Colletotrichum tanaceti]TKW59175.1 putative N-acetyltransferase YoaA [Colletotrichum tanaceti]
MASTQNLPVPILTLHRSIVRPYRPADAPSISRAADSAAVSAFLRDAFPRPYTLADAESWIALNQTPPIRNWAIACPASGAVMGSIGLVPGRDVYSRGYELGYWLGEAFWGRGVMAELVPAFARWVFDGMGGAGESEEDGKEVVERLWAGVFSENAASRKLLEKSGFVCEGRLRRAVVRDGVVMDELVYSLIRADLSM